MRDHTLPNTATDHPSPIRSKPGLSAHTTERSLRYAFCVVAFAGLVAVEPGLAPAVAFADALVVALALAVADAPPVWAAAAAFEGPPAFVTVSVLAESSCVAAFAFAFAVEEGAAFTTGEGALFAPAVATLL
ncbi:hypothetical protein PF007_g20652 [Phytophthora fragariae]|uniref:Uncharacterized protein n=1 Tax=Phytophthora fragariae TaxID=53985 RepID=A0A6A3R1E4_9STRA|nr:hypothetical protein PF007_g20652 [Phytophthora fragariae]KAE9275183.1 hypothetical protein PF008_g29412 [Phytophthora fragariae]